MARSEITPIWKDRRPIRSIFEIGVSPQDEGAAWLVGSDGVTEIACYMEDGPSPDGMPWFAIYEGEDVVARVPAHGFGVYYQKVVTHGQE